MTIKFGKFAISIVRKFCPAYFHAPFLPPLSKCFVLWSEGHCTDFGEGQFQDGPLHKVREEIPSRNLRKKRSVVISEAPEI